MAKSPTFTATSMMSLSHALMGEIRANNSSFTYKFFLRAETPGRTNAAPLMISGTIREVGTDFVRVRKSRGHRTGTDYVIPFHSILYFEETETSPFGE